MQVCHRYIRPQISHEIYRPYPIINLQRDPRLLDQARTLRRFLGPAISRLNGVLNQVQQRREENFKRADQEVISIILPQNYKADKYTASIVLLCFAYFFYEVNVFEYFFIELKAIDRPLCMVLMLLLIAAINADQKPQVLANPSKLLIKKMDIRAYDSMIEAINESLTSLNSFNSKLGSAITFYALENVTGKVANKIEQVVFH